MQADANIRKPLQTSCVCQSTLCLLSESGGFLSPLIASADDLGNLFHRSRAVVISPIESATGTMTRRSRKHLRVFLELHGAAARRWDKRC